MPQEAAPLDLLRDIKRLNDHLVAGAAYPVLEAAGELMPSRIVDDDGQGSPRGAEQGSRARVARGDRKALGEGLDQLPEARLLDQHDRLGRIDPLERPLLELREDLDLPPHQQRIDLDLARRLDARFVERLS